MAGLLDLIAARNPEQAGGLLSDLVAGPRNRLAGLLSDPSGFLQSALSDVVPTNQQAQEQLARYRMPLFQDYAMGPSEYDNKLRDIALGALTVYHGSPHKFDKFDMSKIGTGEGAQAYGHGLYFAESPEVAKRYQAELAGKEARYAGSQVDYNDPINTLITISQGNGLKTKKEVIDYAKSLLKESEDAVKFAPTWRQKMSAEMIDKRRAIVEAAKKFDPSKAELVDGGALYKVDIPDEAVARMLDWDKPLSQQSPEVQKAIKDYATLSGKEHYIPKGKSAPVFIGEGVSGDTAGREFYKWLGDSPAAASDLKAFGIPGIRYLDGGSRNAGQGTYNYVVFDDALPTILERNGQKLK